MRSSPFSIHCSHSSRRILACWRRPFSTTKGWGMSSPPSTRSRQLANLKGYEDDPRKQEAALWLGKYFSNVDPDLASTYLWNATTWWFNSGGGGELGRQVTRSLDKARIRRKDASKKSSGSGM